MTMGLAGGTSGKEPAIYQQVYLQYLQVLGKEPACQFRRHETEVQSLGWEDPLEEGMITHCSILAWRIPWTEEPGELQSIVTQSQTRLKQLSMHPGVTLTRTHFILVTHMVVEQKPKSRVSDAFPWKAALG